MIFFDEESFGANMKRIRLALSANQKDFAHRLGVSPQYLCDVEHDRRSPSVEFVKKVCGSIKMSRISRRDAHILAARAHGWEV
jgi:transcriptional regulator with XRE-family HTH domain